jgi:hypothetical protein
VSRLGLVSSAGVGVGLALGTIDIAHNQQDSSCKTMV